MSPDWLPVFLWGFLKEWQGFNTNSWKEPFCFLVSISQYSCFNFYNSCFAVPCGSFSHPPLVVQTDTLSSQTILLQLLFHQPLASEHFFFKLERSMVESKPTLRPLHKNNISVMLLDERVECCTLNGESPIIEKL